MQGEGECPIPKQSWNGERWVSKTQLITRAQAHAACEQERACNYSYQTTHRCANACNVYACHLHPFPKGIRHGFRLSALIGWAAVGIQMQSQNRNDEQ